MANFFFVLLKKNYLRHFGKSKLIVGVDCDWLLDNKKVFFIFVFTFQTGECFIGFFVRSSEEVPKYLGLSSYFWLKIWFSEARK